MSNRRECLFLPPDNQSGEGSDRGSRRWLGNRPQRDKAGKIDAREAGAPPLEMRIMTKARRAGIVLADDVPNYDGFPVGLC